MADESCCSTESSCCCTNMPENKMCMLTQPPQKFDMEKVKQLTSDPKFICRCCGRTANEEENLCIPTPL